MHCMPRTQRLPTATTRSLADGVPTTPTTAHAIQTSFSLLDSHFSFPSCGLPSAAAADPITVARELMFSSMAKEDAMFHGTMV